MSFVRFLLLVGFALAATLCSAKKDTDKNWDEYTSNVKVMRKRVDETEPKVICSVTSFSQRRHGKGKFLPENIKVDLCTHIIYGPAMIDNSVLIPYVEEDESIEGKKGTYEKINDLKKKNPVLKTLLEVGGPMQDPNQFWQTVTDRHWRKKFTDQVSTYLRKWNFDGLCITMKEMEHKMIAMTDTIKPDKSSLTNFMQDLEKKFKEEATTSGKPKLLLTLTVPGNKEIVDELFDIPQTSKVVDLMIVKGFDLHKKDLDETLLHNALHANPSEIGDKATFNQDWVVNSMKQKGAPMNKLILSVALFGRSFTLKDLNKHEIGAPVTGLGKSGKYTSNNGLLSYYEICENIENGWKTVFENTQKADYAYKGNQWVGYCSVKCIEEKCKFVKSKNLAGMAVVALDMDDFTGNFCSKGKFPLLTKVNDILKMKTDI